MQAFAVTAETVDSREGAVVAEGISLSQAQPAAAAAARKSEFSKQNRCEYILRHASTCTA